MFVLYNAGVRVGRDFLTTGRMFIVRLQVFFLHFNFQLVAPFMKAIASGSADSCTLRSRRSPTLSVIGDVGPTAAWSMRQWTPHYSCALPPHHSR